MPPIRGAPDIRWPIVSGPLGVSWGSGLSNILLNMICFVCVTIGIPGNAAHGDGNQCHLFLVGLPASLLVWRLATDH